MSNSRYIHDLFGLVEFTKLTGDESRQELLTIDRYVRFAELMRALNLDPKLVRNTFGRERRGGVDIDEKYGIYRKGGQRPHLYIKPRQFAKHLAAFKDYHIKTPYKKLPADVSEEAFLQMKGVYKLSDVLRTGHIPMERNRIFRARRKIPAEECGLWKEGGLVLCRIERFLPWAISQVRGISIEEAAKAFKATRERIAKGKGKQRVTP